MNHAIRLSKIVGGTLSLSALALGSSQFYRVSSARLGPGAFLLSIPKLLCAALAPFLAAAGATGAACGLSALLLERGTHRVATKRTGPGAPLVVVAGLSAAAANAMYTRQVVTSEGDFTAAFGAEWRDGIPARTRGAMLARRWTWKVAVASGARVVRDVAFATVPGTHRSLLADLWSAPDGVPPSGLGFIYTHGGGYTAFDKGGPTEPWFRHLAAQGHVVMDVSYRLIPETNVPGMQGDVKRAVAWLKRNADQYGVDPRHIVLGGGSGGSHLALLAAYTPVDPLLTPEDVRGMDLTVRGVIGYYLAGDYRPESKVAVNRSAVEKRAAGLLTKLLERFSGSELAVDDTGDWAPQVLLGGQPEDWPELYRRVSPITHVGPNTPPTLQFVGEHDVYLSRHRREVALHRKLQEVRVPSVYVEFPRTDHAFDMFLPTLSPAAHAAMYDVDRFLGLLASPHEWKADAPRSASPADDE
ncbi:alpha/beta hydrolase [Actinomycetospora cinnamomea]|uniref:Acetyl esterase/lipase n=1 Tax=Actinomycetospora cinnamomea TaxID=663609 RepID=A0A2U1E688_9PSEU|nr:alpha/beta hydrolase [Actinomycetospora cinnamomea]PVY95466.1 acetyl esterase/lipase [Actinomycetospora cinnamomea]